LQAPAVTSTLANKFANCLRGSNTSRESPAHTRAMTSSNKLFVALTLACAVATVPARAAGAAGQLDNTFAKSGIFLATSAGIKDSVATSVAIDSKGRIVVAGATDDFGQVSVVRLNSNGTLDTSFGGHSFQGLQAPPGVASIDFFVAGEIATCLVLEPDGKIVIGISFANAPNLLLARFDEDGTFDTSFANGGLANLIFNGGPNTAFVVQQPDGKFLVGGGTLLARVTANGQRDTTFGQDGLVPLVAPASSIVLQSDGKILTVSGPTGNTESTPLPLMSIEFLPPDSTFLRFNEDGSLDTSFGTQGRRASIIGISGALSQSNGQIVAVGPILSKTILGDGSIASETAFAAARYNSDGSVDDTFGSGGATITSIGNAPFAYPSSVAIQSDGRIIAAGEVSASFALARYTSAGLLDTSFGSSGTVLTSIGPSTSKNTAGIVAVALDAEGQLVAVGNVLETTTTGSGRIQRSMAMVVARYLTQ
jgi:uncharacterized delta-60 repeat protein